MIYKRKRQGKTDYKKRISLLKFKKQRLVVRKTLNNLIAQITAFNPNGDKILISAHTNELKKEYGWKASKSNIPSAYLLGLLIGMKAKKQNIKEAIFDIGLIPSIKGSRVYAVLKGAIDSGLKIPHSKKILPPEERIKGKHIIEYAQKHKERFTKHYPEKLQENLEKIKSKLLEND